MSKVSDFPEGWSFPAGVWIHSLEAYYYPPMVWVAEEPATVSNVMEIMAYPTSRDGVDPFSLVGKADEKYTTITQIIKENELDH